MTVAISLLQTYSFIRLLTSPLLLKQSQVTGKAFAGGFGKSLQVLRGPPPPPVRSSLASGNASLSTKVRSACLAGPAASICSCPLSRFYCRVP